MHHVHKNVSAFGDFFFLRFVICQFIELVTVGDFHLTMHKLLGNVLELMSLSDGVFSGSFLVVNANRVFFFERLLAERNICLTQ